MTAFTDDVREILSPYKFGNDRRAAAMYLANLDSCYDEATGDASEWGLWVARYGRNLLYVQDNGFVESAKCESEQEARDRFNAIEEQYEYETMEEEIPAGYVLADSPDTSGIDFDARYRVEGYRGIAFYLDGFVRYRGSDYEWSGLKYEDRSRVRAIMVGDDRVHEVDVDDLTPLADGDYCKDCGQIGCGWHV